MILVFLLVVITAIYLIAARLELPPAILLVIGGVALSGRLVVQNGSLVAIGDPPWPTIPVLPVSATGALTLGSVTVRPDALVVTGTLAPSAIGLSGP